MEGKERVENCSIPKYKVNCTYHKPFMIKHQYLNNPKGVINLSFPIINATDESYNECDAGLSYDIRENSPLKTEISM